MSYNRIQGHVSFSAELLWTIVTHGTNPVRAWQKVTQLLHVVKEPLHQGGGMFHIFQYDMNCTFLIPPPLAGRVATEGTFVDGTWRESCAVAASMGLSQSSRSGISSKSSELFVNCLFGFIIYTEEMLGVNVQRRGNNKYQGVQFSSMSLRLVQAGKANFQLVTIFRAEKHDQNFLLQWRIQKKMNG